MEIKNIKLTNQMIDIALRDALPSANTRFVEEELPFKRVRMTKHASERFAERFGEGFSNLDISKQIAKHLKNGYYSLTFKDIPSFAIDVKFGEATALIQMSKQLNKFDNKEEIYLVKTLYLKMDESFIKKMEHIHDEKIKDDIFDKMIKDQFFKGKTEQEIFKVIGNPKDEKIVKRIKKAIHETHNMVDPIKEMELNSALLEDTLENDKYKFGDGVKPKPVEKVIYINKDEYDPLDDLLDESLFDVGESNSKFKFGDGEEPISEEKSKKGSFGLDLDASDFPW